MNVIDGLNNITKVNASINCASKIKKMESGKDASAFEEDGRVKNI